ncbi:PPE family protein [Mycobacterium shimoidei]|uniref:PPE family protein PPE43 [Mycobacterium tuberculosis H37Rv] n=1 Tax=Mycobacterium shimoidei TaxID=29313 RepID=A0A1E3TIL5_MYCSH|nr:PPE family protein [Mycobacterium shimoidei]MCV7257380.1 PPE family protein [Mycobacterium shimoidei]ODR14297.1 hypothetical protein BHQ16_05075 [Mycobacterium shimoidei]ORW80374.1 hypothetical protein AWC26_10750 [Mycobacterium shimoidei]SRX95927.1 PPE family protein PPE43 [Mycobacterium tuberculosis H37Rv] [Mycobacterium shimoidei]
MVFDFAARPPEINSALMYSGAGAGPMMAAASAFSSLSSELSANAAAYEAVISQLGSQWIGPSASAMAAAAQPFIAWLNTTSGELQQAASQAIASAAAYEAAFAATVPPPVIAANRAQLAMLVATNILGQNTPAIAANEAMYAEMWAQDAAAMYGYAAASATAAQLAPLTPPAENTNPAAAGLQAAAVGNAVNTNATSSGLTGLLGNLQNGLGSLANPMAGAAAATPMEDLVAAIDGLAGVPMVVNTINGMDVTASWCTMMTIAAMATLGHFMAQAPAGITIGQVTPVGEGLGMGMTLVGATAPAGGLGGGSVLAGMGSASAVGGLSVPAGWSAATPAEVAPATLAGSGWTAATEEAGAVSTVPAGVGMPVGAGAGRGGFGIGAPRYGFKPTVMPKQVVV